MTNDKLVLKPLTISHQDQGALVFGFSISDLNSVCSLIGSGEVFPDHLDHTSRSIMAQLDALDHMKK